MAIGIYFDGRRLIRPQAATKIDDTAMFARGLGGGNTVAVIGECTGGQPQTVQWFTDPAYAKLVLGSGPLLTALQRAYAPSSEVSGAYLVAAIRVNNAEHSTLILKDSVGRPVVQLTSIDYGILSNQIKARVETASGNVGKKVTITNGSTVEQGDDIYKNSLYIGLADVNAIPASSYIGIFNGSANNVLTLNPTAMALKGYYMSGVLPMSDVTTAMAGSGSLFTTYLSTTRYLYIGSNIPFNEADFNIGAGVLNVQAATLAAEYYTDHGWASCPNLVDGTQNPAGTPLAKTGNITFYGTAANEFTYPSGWVKNQITVAAGPTLSAEMYWVRLSSSVALTPGATGDYFYLKRPLKIDLTDYPTVQSLVDYVDAQPGYEAGVLTGSPETDLSTDLDNLGGLTGSEATPFLPTTTVLVDASTMGDTTLTGIASVTSRNLTVAATTNFAVGDYITISNTTADIITNGLYEETRKITAIGTLQLTVDSVPSYAYPIGSAIRECRNSASNLQAVIDWVNGGNTSYVLAAYPSTAWEAATYYTLGEVVLPSTDNDRCYVCTTAGTSTAIEPVWTTTEGTVQPVDGTVYWTCKVLGRGTLNNIPDTYMIDGTEYGSTAGVANTGISQTDWSDAIDLLKTEDVQLVSCVSYDPAVWASLSTHCSYMSGVGRSERIGFCGGFTEDAGYLNGLGKWTSTTQATASINHMISNAMALNSDRMVYVGPGFKAYDDNGILTTYNGAYSAALVAGMFAGSDVATAMTHKTISASALEYNLKWTDLDRLLEAGICPLEYDPGRAYRVCQSITTWLRNDKYNRREVSVRRTADYVARQVRDRLDRDFVGTKGTKTTLISIKNATVSVLTQMFRAELLAGDETNPPFKNIQCRLEGDTCWVDFECSPVIPINYIPVTIHLTVFTSTVTG